MTLRYSARARAHLLAIYEHIRERNPTAASRVGARIREAAEVLRSFPYAGRPGRSANTREWVVQGLPYIIVYQVDSDEPVQVTILGIFHCARNPDDPERR